MQAVAAETLKFLIPHGRRRRRSRILLQGDGVRTHESLRACCLAYIYAHGEDFFGSGTLLILIYIMGWILACMCVFAYRGMNHEVLWKPYNECIIALL